MNLERFMEKRGFSRSSQNRSRLLNFMLPFGGGMENLMSLPVGIQLFSVRDHIEKDAEGTIRELAKMGYQGIEPCNDSCGMDPKDLRALCDELGLRIISAHLGTYELNEETEKTLELYKTLGVEYLAIAGFWGDCVYGGKDYPAMMEKLERSCRYFRDNGIQILYHNHDWEFEKDDGKYHCDIILNTFEDDLLLPEVDTCWASVGHGNAVDYLKRYNGRCPVVHLKDFYCRGDYSGGYNDGVRPEDFALRPVGYGRLDVIDVLHTAEEIGSKWVIVEEDSPAFGLDALECAALCRDWLKKQGW